MTSHALYTAHIWKTKTKRHPRKPLSDGRKASEPRVISPQAYARMIGEPIVSEGYQDPVVPMTGDAYRLHRKYADRNGI